MDSIFNVNKPVKHTGRNGFDTSFSRVVSMRPSVVRPVKIYHTVPNSAYRINVADIVRTGALQTAAFLRGKQELDVYFVPYSQLYSRANDVVLDRGEEHSVSITQLSSEHFPSVPLAGLILNATIPYFWLRFIQFYKEKISQYFEKNGSYPNNMAQNVDAIYVHFYGNFYSDAHVPFNPNLLKDFYYNSSPTSTNWDITESEWLERFISQIDSYDWVGADCLSLLSTCDYGDYYSTMKAYADKAYTLAHSQYEIQYDWLSDPDSWNGYMRTFVGFMRDFLHDFLALIDPNYDWYQRGSYSKLVSLLNLVAYQKVWKDNYRDSICDDSSLYLYASNLDYETADLLNTTLAPPANDFENMRCLQTYLRPRLRAMRRDISNGIYPNPQFGSFATTDEIADMDPTFVPEEVGGESSHSAVAIQFALAMQRYRQTLLRAGTRTKDLLLAEFGVKSQYINDTYPHYVGSFSGDLELNRVSATSESGTYSVGDIAGNVFSSLQGNELEFTCNDHGCLVFCFSFIADPLHNAFGLSPFNLKLESYDFFKEDFENLGLQPVSSHLFTPFVQDSENSSKLTTEPLTLGFGARYSEYKQNYDSVHDDFTTHSFVPYKDSNDQYSFELSVNGAASNYVMVRDISQTVSLMKERSYLMPSCMDTIFKVLDTGFPEDNHFEVAMQFNIKAVLPMSTLGLI